MTAVKRTTYFIVVNDIKLKLTERSAKCMSELNISRFESRKALSERAAQIGCRAINLHLLKQILVGARNGQCGFVPFDLNVDIT